MTANHRPFTLAQALLLLMLVGVLFAFYRAVSIHIRTEDRRIAWATSPDLRFVVVEDSLIFRFAGGSLWEGEENAWLIDLETREHLTDITGPTAFSREGDKLAIVGDDETQVHIWDLTQRRELAPIAGDFEGIHHIQFDGTGNELIAVTWETIRRWNVADGRLVDTLPLDLGDDVEFPTLSPDGSLLATVRTEGLEKSYEIQIRDARNGQLLQTLSAATEESDDVDEVFFLQGGKLLFVTTFGGPQHLWDREQEKRRDDVEHRGLLTTCSPDGRRLAFIETEYAESHYETVVTVYDVERKAARQLDVLPDAAMFSADFARDGKTLAAGDNQAKVAFWDIESGKVVRRVNGLPPRGISSQWYVLGGAFLAWGVLWLLVKPRAIPDESAPADPRQKRHLGWHLVAAVGLLALLSDVVSLRLTPNHRPLQDWSFLMAALILLQAGFGVAVLISKKWVRFGWPLFLFSLFVWLVTLLFTAELTLELTRLPSHFERLF